MLCHLSVLNPDKFPDRQESLLQFPADEIAALLDAEAAREERVLPRVMTFVVTPEQEGLIERAVELASDGTAGRDRKARGLSNLARSFMEGRDDGSLADQGP